MSNWKRFVFTRSIFDQRCGEISTTLSIAILIVWIVFGIVVFFERASRTHFDRWIFNREVASIFAIAWGIGMSLAGVRFSSGQIQALAGFMVIVWNGILSWYLYELFTVLQRTRDIVVYWQWPAW